MTRTTYTTGLRAETMARLLLRFKLYRILAVRHKTPFGEIDLLAIRGRTLVAVEVKARSSQAEAVYAISERQQKRIENALQDYVARHPQFSVFDLRFDVISVTPRGWPRHIKNAWLAA